MWGRRNDGGVAARMAVVHCRAIDVYTASQGLEVATAKLGLVGGTYPRREVRVVFPIEAEGFFVGEPQALAGMVGSGQIQQEAA